MKAITNATLISGSSIVEGATLFFDEKILPTHKGNLEACSEVIDAQGAYVSAGFIDIHIHGSGGADVMDATPEALHTISKTILQTGTTSFLATTMTMSQKDIEAALECVEETMCGLEGANLLGVHLEGPFINANKHGAQDETYVQTPKFTWLKPYSDIIKMITLAPEVEGGEAFIKYVSQHYPYILLSLGHSEANYVETKESFTWGIGHVTHLFNAMTPYHHRKPGIVGACFDSSEVSCDIIPDLVHTHPHALALTYKMKQEKLIVVTDAMRAGCVRAGVYDLGGREVTVKGNSALLADGTLAGSVLKLNEGVANMVAHTAMDLVDAIKSVTQIPAERLGVNKGLLEVGYDADIVIFDKDLSIITTFVAGEVKYKR
jgi:N-acetylglucosamine-6-phosphate deacetylase